jgi:hypothetical protein
MTFPDSTKKAPNVFFDTIDGTGGPAGTGSVLSNGIKVINSLPHPVMNGEYVTSTIYPFLTVDNAQVSAITVTNGYELSAITDSAVVGQIGITTGSLVDTLVFVVYNNAAMENLAVSPINITGGSLVDTLVFVVYNNAAMENLAVSPINITGGSLVESLIYIVYNTAMENLAVSPITIVNGSLV